MKLYHGSKKTLPIGGSLKTPTGVSILDVTSGGVVYLTDTPAACARYGVVYEIDVSSAIPYAVQRAAQGLAAKKGRFTRGVYVALPENTRIARVV